MNITFKKTPIEKVLFFDIETIRNSKILDPDSREFKLYQKKIRNRDTDELPSIEDTQEDYNKRAALKMGFLKIATIGLGFVRAGEVFIKALTGTEEEILSQFFEIASQFDYLAGCNIIGYDLPQCYANASKYFDYTQTIPDKFVTSGKKPWELKNIIDLMEVMRGTNYMNMSLDEMLYHFDLESSKTDIDGSMVSETWYNGEEEKVINYVKQDVFQTINLFSKMQFKEPYSSYIDRSNTRTPKIEVNPLEDMYKSDYLSDKVKSSLKAKLEKNKLTKKDRDFIQDLMENVYIRSEFMDTDNPSVVESKKSEITEFIKTLK